MYAYNLLVQVRACGGGLLGVAIVSLLHVLYEEEATWCTYVKDSYQ